MAANEPDDDRRGWIKLWRKWQKHEMASDPNATLVFLHLLMSAALDTYVNRRFGYTVRRGECDLTIEQLCRLTHLTRDSVREALSRLVRYGTLARSPRNPHCPSITTIVNFNTYNPMTNSNPHQTPTEPPPNPHSTPRLEEVKKLEVKKLSTITAPEVAVTQDALPKAPKTPKAHWSEPQGKQLSLLPDGSPKKVYPFLNKLARQYTEAAVLHALSKSQSETFANWAHATGWLTVVARNSQVTESHVYEDKLDD